MKRFSDQSNVVHLSDIIADGKADLLAEPESVLGHRLPPAYAGVLRSGIKVPYESGKNALSGKERALYEKWILGGRSPREIEKEIKKELRPANVPYFSVYRSECKNNPEHADLIRGLYGNSRGEIHRLRIILISDRWWESIPHNLMAFRRSGLYCSSQPAGGQLIATRDPEIGQEKEKQRQFKRKKVTLPCIPDECPIYAANACRFSGVLHFLILGVPGTDVWRLPTTSWYSVRGIKEKIGLFQSALAAKGRSIVGIPFELFKYEAEISRWDPEKGRVRSKQWIIRIDAPELPLSDLIVQSAGFGSAKSQTLLSSVNGAPKTAQGPGNPALSVLPPENSSGGKEIRETPGQVSDPERGRGEAARREGNADEEKKEGGFPEAGLLKQLEAAILGEIEPLGRVPVETVEAYLRSIGKGHFRELSMEEAKTLQRQVVKVKQEGGESGSGETRCSACRARIPAQAGGAPAPHILRPLCETCRKKDKGALPNQPAIERKSPGQVSDAPF